MKAPRVTYLNGMRYRVYDLGDVKVVLTFIGTTEPRSGVNFVGVRTWSVNV